jgi:PRC-barrel domain protein
VLRIRNLFFKGLQLPFVGAGAIIAGALFLGLAAAQAPPAAPTNQATGDAALNGASLDYFPRDHLFRILGKEVLSAKGEDMGRIVDVLFDEKGEARAAVIDFGGFLGMGTRKIAISWSALRFDLGEKKNVIALDLGREQLKAAPEYKYTESDKPIPVVAQPQPPPQEPAPDPGR